MAQRIKINGVKSTFIDLARYGEGFGALYGESATPTLSGYYSTIAFMYRAIDLRANSLSGVPWAVQNSKGDDLYISTGDELPTAFPWFADIRGLLWQTEAALCLTSTAYWHKLRNGARQIGVRWLQPNTMTPQWQGTEPHPVSYKRQLPGSTSTTTLPAADVAYLYLPGIDETAPRPAPAQAASTAAGVLYNTDRFVSEYFKRGAIKATILQMPDTTPDATAQEFKAWYQRVIQGVKNAWTAQIVLGQVSPVVIGSGIDELSNNTLTMEKREDIATALGVPHSLVLSNAANFATAEADRLNFYETTILPEAGLIAGQLNRQLFVPLGLRFEWRASEMSIYQEDEEQRATAFKIYVDAGILPSIAAQMLGLNLPEGITPQMLDPIQPSSPIFLPAAPPLQLSGPVATVAGEDAAYVDEVRKLKAWAKGKLAPDVTLFKSAILSETDKCKALGLLTIAQKAPAPAGLGEVGAAPSVPPFTRKALLLLDPDDDEAEQKVRRKLEKRSTQEMAKALQDILDELEAKGAQFEHVPHEMAKEFNSLMKEMKQQRKLRDPVERMLVDGVDLGVQTAVTQFENVGYSFAYDLANVAARDWARQYAGELVDQIDDTTKNVVRESLARWIENKEPLQKLIDDISPAFGPERAERIAATEVTRSYLEGSKRTYEESGVVEEWEFRSSNDERTCGLCGPLHEERAPMGEGWVHPEDGETYEIPVHTNCRCWAVPVVAGR
jgi:SPP1 gp7 family putative phage head morphogenesis protein